MKDNVKRAFYVRYVAHPCYLDIIAQRPEIRLDKLENETADEEARPIMAAAHAYQIGSARDELKPRFYVERELLARMPNLLIAHMGRIAAEQLVMTLDGKRPPRIVNPQVWPAYAERFEQTFGFRPQG